MSIPIFNAPSFLGQEQAKIYLTKLVLEGSFTHAYLLSGPSSVSKKDIALRFASALLCHEQGCSSCDVCNRVLKGVHPDVKAYEPQSMAGYLVSTARDIVKDVSLAPVESSMKIYILDDADKLNDAAANAFLKTLEEPASNVLFILLTSSLSNVLETIRSRCQLVSLVASSEDKIIKSLSEQSQQDLSTCACAFYACDLSSARALDFLQSTQKLDVINMVSHFFMNLYCFDAHELLKQAEQFNSYLKALGESLEEVQKAQANQDSDYLSRGAIKALEDQQKRAKDTFVRDSILEIYGLFRHFLRSCMYVLSGTEGTPVYLGAREFVQQCPISYSQILQALDAVDKISEGISYNANKQLSLEVLFFKLKDICTCA